MYVICDDDNLIINNFEIWKFYSIRSNRNWHLASISNLKAWQFHIDEVISKNFMTEFDDWIWNFNHFLSHIFIPIRWHKMNETESYRNENENEYSNLWKLIWDWQHGRKEESEKIKKKVHVTMMSVMILLNLCWIRLCDVVVVVIYFWCLVLISIAACSIFKCWSYPNISNSRRLQNEIGFQNWLSGFVWFWFYWDIESTNKWREFFMGAVSDMKQVKYE